MTILRPIYCFLRDEVRNRACKLSACARHRQAANQDHEQAVMFTYSLGSVDRYLMYVTCGDYVSRYSHGIQRRNWPRGCLLVRNIRDQTQSPRQTSQRILAGKDIRDLLDPSLQALVRLRKALSRPLVKTSRGSLCNVFPAPEHRRILSSSAQCQS